MADSDVPPMAAYALALGDVFLILYSRGVIQKTWDALWGKTSPLTPNVPTSGASPPTGGAGVVGSDQLAAAESAATAAGAPGGGDDWLNWCLQWYDDVMSRLGRRTFYGVDSAQTACNSQQLQPGQAPRGAAICFNDNHIGIANGDGTYTSVGIQHGGPITLPYLNNPAYSGWFM